MFNNKDIMISAQLSTDDYKNFIQLAKNELIKEFLTELLKTHLKVN